ncbi:MAG: hypothetical protein HGA54_05480 [Actinobacteria bacterium]|nr:hypothetical protein [Actinomycetota bacterium]
MSLLNQNVTRRTALKQITAATIASGTLFARPNSRAFATTGDCPTPNEAPSFHTYDVSDIQTTADPSAWNRLDSNGAEARFIIGSDIHIGQTDAASTKLNNAFSIFKMVAPDANAILFCGDLTENGTADELGSLNSLISANIDLGFESTPEVHYVMGNHDFYNSSIADFEARTRQTQNSVAVVNGITIIKLCASSWYGDYTGCYDFLANALREAGTSGKPILVLGHHGIQDTVYVTPEWHGIWGNLITLMQQYPQIIHFSGHSHAPLAHPNSINQDLGFTCIQCSTLGSYFEMESGTDDGSRPSGAWNASQALVLDVAADDSVTIHRLDLSKNRYIGNPWVFHPLNDQPYTIASRWNASYSPGFVDTYITKSTNEGTLTITNPQATKLDDDENNFAHTYHITVHSSTGSHLVDELIYSDFYNTEMADTFTRVYEGISEAANSLTVRITPINPWGFGENTLVSSCPFTIAELGGANRYATMQNIAVAGFDSAAEVIIASGEDFPDALAAAGLAGIKSCPLLLTERASLSCEALSEISRLDAKRATIVGGVGAVSDQVDASLGGLGIEVAMRYSGQDRFETARLIYIDNVDAWGTTAIIASGSNFPDACGAAPIAYNLKAPIFLVGSDGMLSPEAQDLIRNGGFTSIVIAGGTGVISSTVDTLFADVSTLRLGGDSRYETSSLLATYGRQIAGLTGDSVAIASGSNFPDALTAGPLQGSESGGMLLCDSGNTSYVRSWLSDSANCGVNTVRYCGGMGVIPHDVRDAVERAIANNR